MLRLIEIRNAIKQRLIDANIPRIGNRIFIDKSLEYFPDELPAISIYTRRSPCDDEDTSPTIYNFETELFVETVVQGEWNDGGIVWSESDQLSVFSQYVVDALIYVWNIKDGPLDGECDNILLKGVFSGASSKAERTTKGEVVKFAIQWRDALPNETPDSEFLRAGISFETKEEDHAGDYDVEDVIEFEREE